MSAETKDQLLKKIADLENELKLLEEQLKNIYVSEENNVEERINKCHSMNDKFTQEELIFAAYARCSCGCGLAYPKNIGIHGSWYCSGILLGEAEPGSTHDSPLPFAFYEIKSENQPSANGATTRNK